MDSSDTEGDWTQPVVITTQPADGGETAIDTDGYDLRIVEVRGRGDELLRVDHIESNFEGDIHLPRGGEWILTLEDIDGDCVVVGENPLRGTVGPEVPEPMTLVWEVGCP